MTLRSHTADEIRAREKGTKVFCLDSGLAGEDDVLLGESLNDVRIDVALYHGWDDDPEDWVFEDGEWRTEDGEWVMDSETGLPKGWSLKEIKEEDVEDYL